MEAAGTLWTISLDATEERVTSERALLEKAECERADAFRFDEHRRRFILRRAALRRILAAATDTDQRALHFTHNAYGKPALPLKDGRGGYLPFSMSHSGNVALLAVLDSSAEDPDVIGVDIEQPRPLDDEPGLARSILDDVELAAWNSVSRTPSELLRVWTQKEAFVKAVGRGLSLDPRMVAIEIDPASPPRVLRVDGTALPDGTWHVQLLEHHYSAVVTKNATARLTRRAWRFD